MQYVASTLHTTSENVVSSITTADGAHLGCQQPTELPSPLPPRDLNGLVRMAERRNLVSAHVPTHFKRSLHRDTLQCTNCTFSVISVFVYTLGTLGTLSSSFLAATHHFLLPSSP